MSKLMKGHGLTHRGTRITEAGIRRERRDCDLPYIVTINTFTVGIHRTLEDAAQWLNEITDFPIAEILADAERRGYD